MEAATIIAALEACKLDEAETFVALVVHRVKYEPQPTLFVFNAEGVQLDNGHAIVQELMKATKTLLKL